MPTLKSNEIKNFISDVVHISRGSELVAFASIGGDKSPSIYSYFTYTMASDL